MIMSDQNNLTSDELLDDPDDIRVTLELDDEELECAILTIFDVDDQDYIVLGPVDENDEPRQEGEVFIYRYFEDENGNPALDNIASVTIQNFDEFFAGKPRTNEIKLK